MTEVLFTTLSNIAPYSTILIIVLIFYHSYLMKKIDERVRKDLYAKDREKLLSEFDIKIQNLSNENKIRNDNLEKQLNRIENVLKTIQEHMIECNKRVG